jgi:hypothetical protein
VILCGSRFVIDGIARRGGPAERCVVLSYGVEGRFDLPPRADHGGALRVLVVGTVRRVERSYVHVGDVVALALAACSIRPGESLAFEIAGERVVRSASSPGWCSRSSAGRIWRSIARFSILPCPPTAMSATRRRCAPEPSGRSLRASPAIMPWYARQSPSIPT